MQLSTFARIRAAEVLARAARPGEHVGLSAAVVGDGIAQRAHDVLLALQFAETARAIAAIQRLRGHFAASLPLGCADESVRRCDCAGVEVRRFDHLVWVPLFHANG